MFKWISIAFTVRGSPFLNFFYSFLLSKLWYIKLCRKLHSNYRWTKVLLQSYQLHEGVGTKQHLYQWVHYSSHSFIKKFTSFSSHYNVFTLKKNVFQNHHKIFCKVSGSRVQTEKGNIHLLTGSETIELAHTSLNCRMFHGNKFYSFVN